MRKILSTVAIAAGMFAAGSANAYLVFTGIDTNGNANAQVAATNSSAAETAFKSNLVGVGTENFESQSAGASAPLALNFGAAGVATLNGAGNINSNPAGGTNSFGRYSVPGGTQFWEVSAGGGNPFQVDFSNSLAAFGFYGIDLGDFGGTLTLELSRGGSVIGSQIVNMAASGVADGSILYFGLIASNAAEEFDSIRFLSTTGSGDAFAFDSFTIGTKEQIRQLPEPASLALVAGSLLGLGLVRRRRA